MPTILFTHRLQKIREKQSIRSPAMAALKHLAPPHVADAAHSFKKRRNIIKYLPLVNVKNNSRCYQILLERVSRANQSFRKNRHSHTIFNIYSTRGYSIQTLPLLHYIQWTGARTPKCDEAVFPHRCSLYIYFVAVPNRT